MMKNKFFLLAGVFIFSIFLSGCGGMSEEEKREQEIKESAEKIGEEMEKMGENISKSVQGSVSEAMGSVAESLKDLGATDENGEPLEPINHRELKKYMPDEFMDMERVDYDGSTSGIGGLKISQVEGTFRDGDKYAKLSLVDTRGVAMARMGMAAWANVEIDRDSGDEYERTYKSDGRMIHEKFNSKNKRGELNYLINERFVFQCEFTNLEMDEVKDELDDLDMDDLGE